MDDFKQFDTAWVKPDEESGVTKGKETSVRQDKKLNDTEAKELHVTQNASQSGEYFYSGIKNPLVFLSEIFFTSVLSLK